jgi:hypothetical protein
LVYRHAVRLLDAVADRAEPRDIGRRSDDGSVVLTSASTRCSTSSKSARFSGRALDVGATCTSCLALVLDVAGSSAFAPRLALVLDVAGSPAGSPAFTPGCLLLRMVAAFALMIAVLATLSLPLAVKVLAPLSLAVQQLPSAGSGPSGPPNNNEDPWKRSKWNDKRV